MDSSYIVSMKIIKRKNKEDNLWCPPELVCSKTTEKIITKLHDWIYGDSWYTVDPLGHKQVLFVMFEDIPFSWLIKLFIKTEIEIIYYI